MEEADIIKSAFLMGCEHEDIVVLKQFIKNPRSVSYEDKTWFIETFANYNHRDISEYLKKLCK